MRWRSRKLFTHFLLSLVVVALLSILAIVGIISYTTIRERRETPSGNEAYTLHLASTNPYPVNKPTDLQFTIQDDIDHTYHDFDMRNPSPLMVTIIRRDRTQFKHLHPIYDQQAGAFTLKGVVFPADGPYRMFASFRSGDNGGAATVYKDITVSSLTSYTPQPIGGDSLTSSVNGYDVTTTPTTGKLSTLVFHFTKDGQPFTQLHDFKGSVGRLSTFGPGLEFIGTNSIPIDPAKQTGDVAFRMRYPVAGTYRLYLEIEVQQQITTLPFTITAPASAQTHMPMMQPLDYQHWGQG
jgi:hypothetical protein